MIFKLREMSWDLFFRQSLHEGDRSAAGSSPSAVAAFLIIWIVFLLVASFAASVADWLLVIASMQFASFVIVVLRFISSWL